MKKQGKKYNEALSKIEKGKLYTKEDAIKLVKETSTSKFDATVEVAIRLNLDTKKSDQQLRGAIVLPNGTGKSKKVLVVAKGDKAKEAQEAGADYPHHFRGAHAGYGDDSILHSNVPRRDRRYRLADHLPKPRGRHACSRSGVSGVGSRIAGKAR